MTSNTVPSRTQIFTAIEDIQKRIKQKEKYSALSHVLFNIKELLSQTPEEQLENEIGKERYRRIILQLAHALKLGERFISGKYDSRSTSHHHRSPPTLNDITTKLIRIEVDLIPDLNLKKQKLTAVLNSNQSISISHNVHDGLHGQLLETEANLTADQKFDELYLKHKWIIESYIFKNLKEHSSIKISGISVGVKKTVLENFSAESYDNAPGNICDLIEENLELPLQNIYIHLKADPTSSFERKQAQKQLLMRANREEQPYDEFDDATVLDQEYNREVWSALNYMPYMPSYSDRAQNQNLTRPENIMHVLRNHRWTVVLGDPGSGKTTLVRWIVQMLMSTLLAPRIEKAHSNEQDESVGDVSDIASQYSLRKHPLDLGPKRLPVLIRVGEFSKAIHLQSDLTLYDYIGQHTWMGDPMLNFGRATSTSERNSLISKLKLAIQDHIKRGMAFIILDGLDEIPISTHRKHIVKLIENFVQAYVRTPENRSVFELQSFSKKKYEDKPGESGGNQILITSRIVGYHAEPLSGEFSHFTINPLEKSYIQQFIQYWYEAVHQHIIKNFNVIVEEDRRDIEVKGKTKVQALQKQINEKTNPGLFDLATNPCLLGFLCNISFNSDTAILPAQRVRLYEKTVRHTMDLWREKNSSSLNWRKLDSILCDIAEYIHENNPAGLIEEQDLRLVCTQSLRSSSGVAGDASKIEEHVNQCLEIFRSHTGVLAQKGEFLYGFLHQTFQEYYTSRNLINKRKISLRFQENDKRTYSERAAFIFHKHLADPRYAMILSLALGWINWRHEKHEFETFCEHLITTENYINRHLPLAALLLVTSIRDLFRRPPDSLLFKAFNQILLASCEYRWHRNYEFLERDLAVALNKFNNDFIQRWVLLVLSPLSSVQTKELVFTLCHLLIEAGRQVRRTQTGSKSLLGSNNHEEDKEENEALQLVKLMGWANDACYNLLIKYLPVDTADWEYAVDSLLTFIAAFNHEAIQSTKEGLRDVLLTTTSTQERCHPLIMTIIIALCGGLCRNERFPETSVGPAFHYGRYRQNVTYKIEFSPLHMHRESTLDYLIKQQLSEAAQSTDMFRHELLQLLHRIQPDDISLEAVEVFMALFCLNGTKNVWFYEKYLSFQAYQLAVLRLKRITVYLRQYYYMYVDWELSIASDEEPWDEQEDIDTDIQQIILNFMKHLKNRSFYSQHLLKFLGAISSSRTRLCTTSRSFLNPHVDYKTNHYELNLPDEFSDPNFIDELLYNLHNNNPPSLLSYFVRLLWSFRNDADMNEGYAEGRFDKDLHSKFLNYNNTKDPSYALAFVSNHLHQLYDCLIESNLILIQNEEEIIPKQNQLPFTHILLECSTNLRKHSCHNKKKAVSANLKALIPLLNYHGLQSIIFIIMWKICEEIETQYQMEEFLRSFQNSLAEAERSFSAAETDESTIPHLEIRHLSKANVKELLDQSIDNDRIRIQQAINNRHQSNESDYQIYRAIVCLDFAYSYMSVNDVHMLDVISRGLVEIQNPLLKLDALLTLAGNDSGSLYVFNGSSIENEIIKLVNDRSLRSTSLIYIFLLLRCMPVLHDITTKDELLKKILAALDEMTDEKHQEAVISALIGIQKLSAVSCPIFSHLKRCKDLMYLSTFKSGIFHNCFDIHYQKDYFLSNYAANTSVTVIMNSLYLAELASDVQMVHNLCGRPVDNNSLKNSCSTLIYTRACSIDSMLSLRQKKSNHLQEIEEEMYSIGSIDARVSSVLQKWLVYQSNSRLYSFACHAALLLCENYMWNASAVQIICHLLTSENDRFRIRARTLLVRSEYSSQRRSSAFGVDVFQVLLETWLVFRASSAHGALFLARMFDKMQIDNIECLNCLLNLEYQRITRNTQIPVEKQVSLFLLINTMSLDVLEHFMSYLLNITTAEGTAVSKLFIKNLLRVASKRLLISMDFDSRAIEEPLLTETLWNIANNTSLDEEIRLSALEALSYSRHNTVITIFVDLLSDSQLGQYSENYITTVTKSFCTCLQRKPPDNLNVFEELRKDAPSKTIAVLVSNEIGRVYQDLHELLTFFNGDYLQCYNSLLYATKDREKCDACSKAIVELIERYHSLLEIFLLDLLTSIEHFTDSDVHPNSECFVPFPECNLLTPAELLIQRMPASVELELNEKGISDRLKKAIYFLSKQHNYQRRINCLNILSHFKELTLDLSEMLVQSQLDVIDVQRTSNLCISRITTVQPAAVQYLIVQLQSESLSIRYSVGLILTQLVKSKTLSVEQVQNAFLSGIQNDEIDNLHQHAVTRLMYSLLVEISYTVPERPKEEENDNVNQTWYQDRENWLIRDYQASEKATQFAFCLVSKNNQQLEDDEHELVPVYGSEINSERGSENISGSDEDEDEEEHPKSRKILAHIRLRRDRKDSDTCFSYGNNEFLSNEIEENGNNNRDSSYEPSNCASYSDDVNSTEKRISITKQQNINYMNDDNTAILPDPPVIYANDSTTFSSQRKNLRDNNNNGNTMLASTNANVRETFTIAEPYRNNSEHSQERESCCSRFRRLNCSVQ